MPKRNIITSEEVVEIKKIRQKNNDKTVDKWLEVLILHSEGKSRAEISEKTGFKKQYITSLVGEYRKVGLENFAVKQYKGNRRNLSLAEEKAFIDGFKKLAETGQIVTVKDIKAAYEAKVGHKIGNGQIYRVLKRQKCRKVMPRSRHPKKASAEVIESTKNKIKNSGKEKRVFNMF